jgi:uncharacterized protein YjbJ (UPF0337 family)
MENQLNDVAEQAKAKAQELAGEAQEKFADSKPTHLLRPKK